MDQSQRLLPLAPNISMILFALEADDLVVGRTGYCLSSIRNLIDVWQLQDDNLEARLSRWEALPEVGSWPEADAERIAAVQPDLVLMSETGAQDSETAARLGLPADRITNFDIRTLSDLDRQIETIGRIVRKPEATEMVLNRLAHLRELALSVHVVPAKRPKVLFEYCVCIKYHPDPLQRFANPGRFVMAGGYLAPELIRLAGGEPLFADTGDSIAWTDFRVIKDAQPDVILTFDCGGCPNALKHPAEARAGWSDLHAMSNDAVFRPRKNIANPNLCYPQALAELAAFVSAWRASSPKACRVKKDSRDML